jgi:hypothetical protein
VAPHSDFGSVTEEDLLPLADAQTSGGLLVAGAGRAGDRRARAPWPGRPGHLTWLVRLAQV